MNVLPNVYICSLGRKAYLFLIGGGGGMYTSGNKADSQKVPTDVSKTGAIAQSKDFSGTSEIF